MNPATPEYEIIATGDVRIQWDPAAAFDVAREVTPELDAVWQEAVAQSGGHLFNGTYLNFVDYAHTPDGLVVRAHFSEYRHFYVHRLRPDLGLPVKSIGVSGMTFVGTGAERSVLVATRGPRMTQYPGYLELVPSGTIDQSCAAATGEVRYEDKVVEELYEEAQVDPGRVRVVERFAFLHDRVDDSYDACCILELEGSGPDVLERFPAKGEYESPILVPVRDLEAFSKSEGQHLLPISKGLIAAYLSSV